MQEFVLGWSLKDTAPFAEIVRQQFNFSPPGTVAELEEYQGSLEGVKALELIIRPEIGGGHTCASLASWRIA